MHSPFKSERLWFSHLLESQSLPSPTDTPLFQVDVDKKRRIHELLARSEVLDNFLQVKFPNLKRVWSSLVVYSFLETNLASLFEVWIGRGRVYDTRIGFVVLCRVSRYVPMFDIMGRISS